MKILYGVQGTGQGHISRARAMAAAFEHLDVEVTWLFSGRPKEAFFDMEPFGDFLHRRGLSFATRAGQVSYLKTVTSQNLPQFLGDVFTLDVTPYDLVVTDYEPVTAWAGRRAGIETIGIGHQYAFGERTPHSGGNWLTSLIMRMFAPVARPVGLHWHPYAQTILPPILDLPPLQASVDGSVLVYLPFEDQDQISALLQQIPQISFVQYSAQLSDESWGNVRRCRANIHGFKRDLKASSRVICNSGFELVSECLQWQKPVLTKPLIGQMEQLSNALALEQLSYATVTHELSKRVLEDWIVRDSQIPRVYFPNVAPVLARWLEDGAREAPARLSARLWRRPLASDDHCEKPLWARPSVQEKGRRMAPLV